MWRSRRQGYEVLIHGIASAAVDEYASYYDTLTANLTGLDWPSMEDAYESTCYMATYTVRVHLDDDSDVRNELIEAIRNGYYEHDDNDESCDDCDGERSSSTDAEYDTSDAREFFRALTTLGVNY